MTFVFKQLIKIIAEKMANIFLSEDFYRDIDK